MPLKEAAPKQDDTLDSKEEGDLLDSKEEQGSPHDSKEKQVSPHNEEEGDLQSTTPRVRTGYDTATPTGYDTESALDAAPGSEGAEDDAGEEADPQKRPAAKVTVTIAGAGAKDNIAEFVQAFPPPHTLASAADAQGGG